MTPESPRFRPDIEGLRAVAILLVVGYHAGVPGFRGGYVGVDVFFVISGYLITWLLVREAEETGRVSLVRFYARRARRLLPALAVMLAATVVLSALVHAPMEQRRLANTAVATAAYASNVGFARWSTDYLAREEAPDPLLHTWSLSVEEQFYLVWPLLVLLALGVRRAGAPNRRRLLAWMVAVGGLSFALSLYLTAVRQPWAFFLSPPRAWEFAAGAVGMLVPRLRATALPVRSASGWAGLAGLGAAAVAFGETTRFPGVAALLPVLSTVLLLRAGANAEATALSRALGARPMQVIGRLSYAWYLWHWPALVLAAAVAGPLAWPVRLALVAASLAVAAASYRFVEAPVRRSALLARRPGAALAMAAGLAVVGVVGSLAWGRLADRWARGPGQARYTAARDEVSAIYGPMDCDVGLYRSAVKTCAFGPAGAPRTAVLFGDSHAGQWFPAVEAVFRARGWRLVVVTKSACPAVDAPLTGEPMRRTFEMCRRWRPAAVRRVHAMRPDLVLVGSSDGYAFSPEAWEAGTRRVLASLAGPGTRVVLIRDVPHLGFNTLLCRARRDWRPTLLPGAACTVRPEAGDDPVYRAQRRAAAGVAGASTLDLNAYIRPHLSGPDGVVAYRDPGHLSVAFARSLAGPLGRALDDVLDREPAPRPGRAYLDNGPAATGF